MSSAGPPTYTAAAARPDLEHMNMSYFSGAASSQNHSAGYDEEAAQAKGTLKKQGSLRKQVPLLEKDDFKPIGGGGGHGVHSRPVSSHHPSHSHSLSIGTPANNSTVVLNHGMQKTMVGRVYAYLLTASIVTRWMLFIIPVLGILWIPGILALTKFRKATAWGVGLLWWSIWLSILWGGWWAALAAARIVPTVTRATIGVVAVSSRKYIDWMYALHRYTAFFAWSVAIWVSYLPIISTRRSANISNDSSNALDIIGKLLLGSVFCSGILLFEKFSIQWIAAKFHERSYAERIADQKVAVRTLVVLYRNSVSHRSDTLENEHKASEVFRKIKQHVRLATTTTATVFGNVASEIAGSSVLQPNSPQAIVKTALESANKSRVLARRIFYSFAQPGSDFLLLEDFERVFETHEEAMAAFSLFDRDNNGDVSKEELESTCLDFHREQLSIENSMQNLDSAVGRLDNIFMSLYVIIAIIIFAAVLDTHVGTLLTGAGASFLGLSWLIGVTCQEVLASILFLFIKHPFDVGDRVIIKDDYYTVKEIRLLSTVFLDKNSTLVQAPNNQLTTLFICNLRRSPQMSETITFDVGYSTSFHDIEKLRGKMLEFLKNEKRDFETAFDVSINDMSDQTKMTLSVDIKYKSNIQQGALKARRRNKWLCALKTCLAEVKMFGPSGDPDAPPAVDRYTEVPWEMIDRKDKEDKEKEKQRLREEEEKKEARQDWKLGDRNAALMDPADDVFGDAAEVRKANPTRTIPSDASSGISTGVVQRPIQTLESFEMKPRGGL